MHHAILAAMTLSATLPFLMSCQDKTAPAAPTPAIVSASATPTTTSSSRVLEPTASCPPWEPSPRTLVARTNAGRGDFFREFHYEFASGVIRVHDSDPFAHGKEAKEPRVTKQEMTLEPSAKEELAAALVLICPDAAAMRRSCAPGGCARLIVTRGDATETKVEHGETVGRVMKLLEPHFPSLRKK